jgi:hypothetical protein
MSRAVPAPLVHPGWGEHLFGAGRRQDLRCQVPRHGDLAVEFVTDVAEDLILLFAGHRKTAMRLAFGLGADQQGIVFGLGVWP